MDLVLTSMKINNGQVHINRFEVVDALFRAEDCENDDMHSALNILYNYFCREELKQRRNVMELVFEITSTNESVIRFIESSNCY